VMVCSDRHKLMGLVVGWPGYNRIMRVLLSENNEDIIGRKKISVKLCIYHHYE